MQRSLSFLKIPAAILLIFSMTAISSCKKKDSLSNLAGITSFSIKDLPLSFTIDEAQQKIYNADSLPFETDVSHLVAQFSNVPNSTVKVGSTVQQSGVTVNDFSSPLTYSVVAQDGQTTRDYTVMVNVTKTDPETIAWQHLTADAGWGNFHSVSVAAMGSKFYMVGGTMGAFGSFNFTSNVSDNGNVWTRTRAVDNNGDSVPRVEAPGFISFNNKLWILGGHRPGVGFAFDDVTNKVWSSSDGISWAANEPAVATDRWSKRERVSTIVFNSKLWVIGGNDYPAFGNSNSPGTAYNDVWNSTDGTTWTSVNADAAFIARTNPSVFVYNNKIWIAGGRDNGGNYLNDIWNSADGNTWTEVTPTTPFPARFAAQVLVHGDKIFLVGGEDATGVKKDMWLSENGGVVWKEVNGANVMALPASFKARKDFSMFEKDGAIYIIGGLGTKDANSTYSYVNDVWKGKLQ